MWRQFFDYEEEELGSIERDEIIAAFKDPKQGKREFLEKLNLISDTNFWKTKRTDVLYWHEVYNIIDDMLDSLIPKYQFPLFTQKAHQWKLLNIYAQAEDLNVKDEVLRVLLIISSKRNDKKSASSPDDAQKGGLENFDQELKQSEIPQQMKRLLSEFEDRAQEMIELRDDCEMVQIDASSKISQTIRIDSMRKQAMEDEFVFLIRLINLYHPDIAKGAAVGQKQALEQLLPPKVLVDKFIKILQNPYLNKKVHTQVINVFFLFIILDLNQLFNYAQPTDNQYYLDTVQHHEFLISILNQLAAYHCYYKIKDQSEQVSSFSDEGGFQQAIQLYENLIGEDIIPQSQIAIQSIKSQKYLKLFLDFLTNILNIRNKSLQNQIYPQCLKPLLALVCLKPIGQTYYLNPNCQLKAAKLLKDVVKQSTINDPIAIDKVIDRLRFEIRQIGSSRVGWKKFEDDDTENDIIPIYSQDLARTMLRFLSYSIIRNDPTNSRRILENGIIQEDMMNFIFKLNLTADRQMVKAQIDPILLQCKVLYLKFLGVQLISYVFNDLPQKLPQFVESGYLQPIIDSLTHHIPNQADILTILMKFIQTLCLNSQSTEMLVGSSIIKTLSEMVLDPLTIKNFVSISKTMIFRDLIQSIAMNNKDLAYQMCESFFKTLDLLVNKAWGVTQEYVAHEEFLRNNSQLTQEEKDLETFAYERKQINLERTCEAGAFMIWYFAIDEHTNSPNNFIHQQLVAQKDYIIRSFKNFITTPIIASACENSFHTLIEIMLQILQMIGEEAKDDCHIDFLKVVMNGIDMQVKNAQLLLQSEDFDQIEDIPQPLFARKDLILDDHFDGINVMLSENHLKIIERLSGEDQLAVVFSKIAFYCEIIKQSTIGIKQILMQSPGLIDIITKLFKIQAFVNRYHSCIYLREIRNRKERLAQLLTKYPNVIQPNSFENFNQKGSQLDEKEELKHLYYRFEVQKVSSFLDNESRKNERTLVEVSLDGNLSSTSNLCQLAIRRLLNNLLRMLNRKKMHFSEKVERHVLEFNKLIGSLIAVQFSDFIRFTSDNPSDEQLMRCCCWFSSMFSEFNKILFEKIAFGSMFLGFVNNGGLKHVKSLTLWLLEVIYQRERQENLKRLDVCRSIQLIWSHVIDFYFMLLEGKYLDEQFSQFMISFKSNPMEKVNKEKEAEEYDLAVGRMRKYFLSLFTEQCQFLFIELKNCKQIAKFNNNRQFNAFDYFDKTSELFSISYLEIYTKATKAFQNCKIFNEIEFTQKKNEQASKPMSHEDKIDALVDMGYTEDQAIYALEESRGILNLAIEILTETLPFQSPEVQNKKKARTSNEEEKTQLEENCYQEIIEYGSYTHKDLYKIIRETITDFMKLVPSYFKHAKKEETLDNLYFSIGKEFIKPEVLHLLKDVKRTILELITECLINKDHSIVGTLCYSVACFLSYRRGELLSFKETFQAIFEIILLAQMAVGELKQLVDASNQELNQHRIVYLLKQIEHSLQLFLFVSEESKISSDLQKIGTIVKSATQQPKEGHLATLQHELEQIAMKNESNIFCQSREQTAEIFSLVTILLIDFYKSLHNMHPSIDKMENSLVYNVIKKSLENLNFMLNIKGYANFDCQQCFLQNEGLRALFSIRFVNLSEKQVTFLPQPEHRKSSKEIQVQSKILLQQLCSNDQSQIKIYENLIKSIMFIQFQEVYKIQEGEDLKNAFAPVEIQQNAPQQLQSKKKKAQTPVKTSKANEKMQNLVSEDKGFATTQKNQSKNLKQLIFNKQEYGVVPLEDFINFFSGVMQIQDLKSFLLACQNVCIIKKTMKDTSKKLDFSTISNDKLSQEQKESLPQNTPPPLQDNEELKNDQNTSQAKPTKILTRSQAKAQVPQFTEVHVIALQHSVLREMIMQHSQNSQQQSHNAASSSNAESEKQQKNHIQKFQQDIVFTFLDMFIDQIRDQQMLILSSAKQKTNLFGIEFIQSIDQSKMLLKDTQRKINDQQYMFDIVCIMSHLTYIVTHTPILVQSLLKHKEGKTFKFIIRNIYFLIAFELKKSEIPNNICDFEMSFYQFALPKKQCDQITEFFKRVMLDNPHLTIQEKKLKQDARSVFIKELSKNLCESTSSNKYPQWLVLGLIFNLGALWLISQVLKDEDGSEPKQEKNFEQLVVSMQKFRNIIRNNMVKQLIYECQSQGKQIDSLHIIRQIERIQDEIQQSLPFFNQSKEQIYLVINSLSNILRPFESSKALQGDKDLDKGSLIGESNLGFMKGLAPSVIDEDMEEDEEDDDEEDDEESESESAENEDDDLLDSERSERNFRNSEAEEFDEEYDDENLDDDEDDDLDQDDNDDAIERGLDQLIGEMSEGDNEYDEEEEDGSSVLRVNPRDLDLIENYLGAANEDEDEDEEDDYDEEDDAAGQNQEAPSERQVRNSQPNEEAKQDQVPGQAGQDEEMIDDEGEYDDEEYDEEEGESEDYYDEEIDDDDSEVEIEVQLGRGPAMERLSHLDYAAAAGGPRRRDDALSLNNLSVDMFNLQHLNNNRHLQEVSEESHSMHSENQDNSQMDDENNNNNNRGMQIIGNNRRQEQIIQISGDHSIGDILSNIRGFFQNNRTRGQGSQYEESIRNLLLEKLNQDKVAYSPLEVLTQIYEINREMLELPEIYKLFIKEHQEANPRNQQTNQQQVQQQQSDIEKSTTSQASLGKNDILQLRNTNTINFKRGNNQTNAQSQINTISNNMNSGFEDDIDPLFMENLDADAYNSLIQTEQVIKRIHIQSNQIHPDQIISSTVQLIESIRDPLQRAEIYRGLADETFNQLPPNMFAEGVQYRPNLSGQQRRGNENAANALVPNNQAQPPSFLQNLRPADDGVRIAPFVRLGGANNRRQESDRRGRILSIDSQLNDMADFSRGVNDPYFRSQSSNLQRGLSMNQNSNPAANALFNSSVQYLKDLITEMSHHQCLDSKGLDIYKHCEQLVASHLSQQNSDNIEQNFNKVNGLVQMIMVWIKYLTSPSNGGIIMYKDQSLIKTLFRLSYIRNELIFFIFKWMAEGIDQFSQYAQLNHKKGKPFMVERGNGLPGKLDVLDFVLYCLKCFKQIIAECNKFSSNASLDLLKVPSSDPLHRFLLTKVNQSNFVVNPDKPLIEQIVEKLVLFTSLVISNPEIVNLNQYVIEGKEVWMEDIITALQSIFQSLGGAAEAYQVLRKLPENQALPEIKISDLLINQLGDLLLTKEFKQKDMQKMIKQIFSDISKISESNQVIEQFFKHSLSKSLNRFLDILCSPKRDGKVLQKEIIIITQILKIAKNSKQQESNICDEDLFFSIVREVSLFIDRMNIESLQISVNQASFVFKEEFRSIMMALFILFDYNLKFIFTENQDEALAALPRVGRRANATAAQRRQAIQQQRQAQRTEVLMQSVDEMKLEIESMIVSKEKTSSLMEAIDEHLKIKIKDERTRSDKRLKIFIKFCLEHKKIINSFIRANQQIVNESLRNVIMKVPQILDFDNKRLIFRSQIKKIQRKHRMKYIDIQVRRDHVFDDSYEQLRSIGVDRWKGQLNVEFADEQGIDEGGLSREWFILLSQQIFNPDLALFIQSNAGTTYYPNPKSDIHPDYINQFKFIGHIVGKAILEAQLLDCYFVKALYKIILGLSLNYHDVEDFDNELYKNLKWCLENDVEGLSLTFTETVDYYGQNQEIEIIEGGKELEVTDANKADYVQRMAFRKLYGSIQKQIDAFLQGFYDVVPKHLIQLFDNRELELLISGLPSIDIMDLKENTIYQNYSAETPVIKWLFQVLEEFDNSERAEFIQFVTGSSKVPVEGFKGLRGSRGIQKFQVVKFFTDNTNRLPQAHTCFKQLELPEYTSKEQLKDRLLTAIKEGKTFGFA